MERLAAQKAKRQEEKVNNANARRKVMEICTLCARDKMKFGGWGAAHCWRCSAVDQHELTHAPTNSALAKLLKVQSKTHSYLFSMDKWLDTLGPAQDYWLLSAKAPPPEPPRAKAKAKGKRRPSHR